MALRSLDTCLGDMVEYTGTDSGKGVLLTMRKKLNIGLLITVIVAVAAICGAVVYWLCRRAEKKKEESFHEFFAPPAEPETPERTA